MKSVSVFLAIGLIAFAQGQDACLPVVAKIPTCANSCILSAAGGVGCNATDFKCQCSPDKSAAIAETALPCVVSACGPVTGLAVQSSAAAVCECAATAAPNPASTTSAVASSTPASSTPAVKSTAKSSSGPVASAKPSVPTTSAPPFSTTSATKSTAVVSSTSAPSASGTGKSSSGGSSVPYTGGAAQALGSVAGFLGALLAAIWAL